MASRMPVKARSFTRARASTSASKRRSSFMLARSRLPATTLRTLSSEVKSIDVPVGTYNLNLLAAIVPLNLVATGTAGSSFFNRVGRRIEMKSLLMKAVILPLRTTTVQDYVRVMIVYDRQSNGAAPSISDILQTTSATGANTTTVYSDINLNNRDRFSILRDHRIYLPSVTDTAGVLTAVGPVDPISLTFNVKDYIKLKGLVTQYKADSNPPVLSDLATGGLFLVTLGTQVGGTNDGWALSAEFRLRYFDR